MKIQHKETKVKIANLELSVYPNNSLSAINSEKMEVEVILSDETQVLRYSWRDGAYKLTLRHDSESVVLDRADILKVFYEHETSYGFPLGFYKNVRLEDGKIKATAVLDKDDEQAVKLFKKIENNNISSVSVGINILEVEEINRTERIATKWEILEASFVNIPANPNAKIGLQKQKIGEEILEKKEELNVENIKKESFDNGFKKGIESERTRLSEIAKLKGGGQDELIDNLSLKGLSAEKIAYQLAIQAKEKFKAIREAEMKKNIELNDKIGQIDIEDETKKEDLEAEKLETEMKKELKGE